MLGLKNPATNKLEIEVELHRQTELRSMFITFSPLMALGNFSNVLSIFRSFHSRFSTRIFSSVSLRLIYLAAELKFNGRIYFVIRVLTLRGGLQIQIDFFKFSTDFG